MPVIPILGSQTRPDGTGNCFQEPASIKFVNDLHTRMVWVFNDATCGMGGQFRVPADYSSGAKFIVDWTATNTSGGVQWEIPYNVATGDDAVSLDFGAATETATATDSAPSAAYELLSVTATMTATKFIANGSCSWTLRRNSGDAADTMAAAALLDGLYFSYST